MFEQILFCVINKMSAFYNRYRDLFLEDRGSAHAPNPTRSLLKPYMDEMFAKKQSNQIQPTPSNRVNRLKSKHFEIDRFQTEILPQLHRLNKQTAIKAKRLITEPTLPNHEAIFYSPQIHNKKNKSVVFEQNPEKNIFQGNASYL